MKVGRILCLDVGDRNIGLAVTDELRMSAFPYGVVVRDGKEISNIIKVIEEKEIKTVVVGLPRNLKGEIGTQAEKVMEFVKLLKENNSEIEVIMWDERLTSLIAKRIFKEMNVKFRSVKTKKDALEAAIILESYIERAEKKEYE